MDQEGPSESYQGGYSTAASSHLKGNYKGKDIVRGNSNKFWLERFRTNSKKNLFFIQRIAQHWNAEAVESPSSKVFKIQLDKGMCDLI